MLNWLIDFASDYKQPNNESQIMSKIKAENQKQKINGTFSQNAGFTGSALLNILNAYQTSAIKAEKQATLDAQEFQKQQANLAWQRSESSALKQMQFQKQQADLAWQRSESSAQKQMDFQREMWQKSVDYNTEMSNTAYQRTVQDLRKAGLNPILAVSQGGASTPTATVPSGSSSSAHAMSGASASASAQSGYKADYSKAKQTDMESLTGIFGLFTNALTSALKLLF